MSLADTTEDRVATLHSLLNDAAKKVGEQRQRIAELEEALANLMFLVGPLVRDGEFSPTWRRYVREARATLNKSKATGEAT